MPKLTMPKQPVRKDQEQEEDRGDKAPVLLAGRGKGFLGRLGSAGRGYALAGAGVVAAAVVAVSLLSWLAPDSDRPIASPLEAVGRVAGGVVEQVDDQVEALLGTYGENTVLRSVREGLVAASSATPWPSGNPVGNASSPSSSTASPDSASSSTGDDAAAAPSRGGESSSASDGTPPSQAASSTPSSSPSETPTSTEDTPSPPTAREPAPPASEEPPVAEEQSTPPPSAEPPPAAEEPVPPSTEEPPPVTEEEPPPPVEGPPETSADE